VLISGAFSFGDSSALPFRFADLIPWLGFDSFGLGWWVCVGFSPSSSSSRVLAYLLDSVILGAWLGTGLGHKLTRTDSVQEARHTMSKSKNSEVVSSLDVVNAELVTTGKALVGAGTELETAWFNDSALLLISNKISVRGVQLSMDEALADFDEDVAFPSLTKTMVQNFVQAYALTQKKGWKGLPVEAIRTIQNGKRSESFVALRTSTSSSQLPRVPRQSRKRRTSLSAQERSSQRSREKSPRP